MEAVTATSLTPPMVGALCGDGWIGATPAPGRTMGRCGGPLGLPPYPLVLCLLVLAGWCTGVGVAAARLPSGHGLHQGLHGSRLAPGPSVEDDNPLPPSASASGHQTAAAAASQQQRRCAAMPARVLRQVLGPAYNPAYMAFTLEDPRGGVGGGFGPFQSDGPRGSRGTEAGAEVGGDQQHPSRVLKESPWPSDTPQSDSPFAVDEDYRMVLSDEPAWQTRYDMAYDMPTVMLSGDAELDSSSSSASPRVTSTIHNYRISAGRRARADEAGEVEEAEAEDEADGGARAARAAWGGIPGMPMVSRKDMQWHCESPLRWVDLGPDYFPRYLRSADCAHSACTGAGFVCRPRSFSVKVLRRREGMCASAGDLHVEESNVGLPSELRDLWVWELRAVNFCCVCSLRM